MGGSGQLVEGQGEEGQGQGGAGIAATRDRHRRGYDQARDADPHDQAVDPYRRAPQAGPRSATGQKHVIEAPFNEQFDVFYG